MDLPHTTSPRRRNLAKSAKLWVLVLALPCVLSLPLASQSDPYPLPGDPVGPEDLVFVDLDSSEDLTCGVTAAKISGAGARTALAR